MKSELNKNSLNDKLINNIPGGEREKNRYLTLLKTLAPWKPLLEGKKVLDFGASWGTSLIAMSSFGASEVIGIEPDRERVEKGSALISKIAPQENISILHVSDTSKLPFDNESFDFILANAVFEHIPQPRQVFIKELWRVLSNNGVFMINETPNKYFPLEVHTTQLWCNHWLPKHAAYKRAIKNNRFDPKRSDWDSSGWRGMGYYEIVESLSDFSLIPETNKFRHRLLKAIGLPASIFDPYPTWVFRKNHD